MIISEDDYLAHYGILRKSGRYPWGSGETQSERNKTFLSTIESMRKQGMSEADIARSFNTKEDPFTTSDLRALKSIAVNQQRRENIATAEKLKAKGMSNIKIGEQMGLNESSVRNLLAPGAADRADRIQNTADMLRRQLAEKQYIDIGSMAAAHIGVNDTQLKTAVAALREEGYQVIYPKIEQVGAAGNFTTMKVLVAPDVPKSEAYAAAKAGAIRQIQEHTEDHGNTFLGIQPPLVVSSKRIRINYKEDGGAEADGVIYVRPGVPDLDMGGKRYAQVRIAVDGTHYLKGMAVLKDDLPDGVDLLFNTNKSNTGNKLDAMKSLKRDKEGNIDPDNPFGAVVRQLPKLDEHGNPIKNTVRSAMNIVNDEGQWDTWSKNLSTQFLSKQSPTLIRQQLDMTYERKKNEFENIMRLTNPAVKRQLLESFADDVDASAVHLKAQHLPRQRTQVILPLNSLKENEVYAPNFKNGERVVLVRHPHGGVFEIPELTVNNRNPEGKKLLGEQAQDAIGIHHKVAERLSGADFDGDTVLVIPNNSGAVRHERALEGLKNFNPQESYAPYDGMKTIDGGTYNAKTKSVDYGGRLPKGGNKQNQMGMISNLITDMTIKGANHDELAAAVRHSMVVIDAEKHALDYKRSAIENNIPALTKKYQNGKPRGGASTLISQAKSEISVPRVKPRPAAEGGPIDRATGKKVYVPTGESYINKNGELVVPQSKLKRILTVDSAHELSSGSIRESYYADHSDKLQALANQARKAYVETKPQAYSPSAKEAYAPQVKSLNAKLALAELNAPRERQAQILANSIVSAKKAAYPDMEKSDLKKIKGQALAEARLRTGAKKERVDITQDEWNAIQAGAISNNKLERILRNSNLEDVKKLAMPRTPTVMTTVMQARAESMLASGYSQADVAAQLGVAVSTLKSSLSEGS
jgi:DNA-binding CsgD family transcriptional regulator